MIKLFLEKGKSAIQSFFAATDQKDRFYSILFWLVLAGGILLRFPYIFSERMWSDEGLYAWFGKRIFEQPLLAFAPEVTQWHPPLFSILLALGHIFLPSELASRYVLFVIYVVGIMVIYSLGKEIKSPFVGCFSAMVLAFHSLFFACSARILIDVPITVAFMILVYFLIKVRDRGVSWSDWAVGLAACGPLLMKSSGVLVLPLTAAYYLWSLSEITFRRRVQKLCVPLAMMLCVLILLAVKNKIQFGNIFFLGMYVGTSSSVDYSGNLWNIFSFIGSPYVMLFALVGLPGMPRKAKGLLFFWFIIFVAGLLSIRTELETRFILYLLPCLILLVACGVERCLDSLPSRNIFFKETIKRCFILFLIQFLFIRITNMQEVIRSKDNFCIGYREAATAVRHIYRPGTLVLAGSERQMRYYSGINFQEFGGDMIMFRQDQKEFARLVQNASGNVIVEIDLWEPLQPAWANPLTRETVVYLKSLGFELVQEVARLMPTEIGVQNIPVAWVFARIRH